MRYDREPVSFDVTFARPVPVGKIRLDPGPCQVEIIDGAPGAVRKARLWTLVTLDPNTRHVVFTASSDGPPPAPPSPPAATVTDAGEIGGLKVAVVSNGIISARLPVGGATFDEPVSAFRLPGPVVSIRRDANDTLDAARWIGTGYIDSPLRIEKVTCQTVSGSVYFESRLDYAFEGGRHWRIRARVYPTKPYVQLVEDFNVGAASRFVFNYDDWLADAFFRMGDNKLYGWETITDENPCNDFVTLPGQNALARLVIWTQHNYFGGKQETIALKCPDPAALDAAHAAAAEQYPRDVERYKAALAKWESGNKDPRRKPSPPRQPVKPEYKLIDYALDGASMRAASVTTPPGRALAVGAFYIRPDLWTRAKVNHVDLYVRHEVPGEPFGPQRRTRGIVGLEGARLRAAMEAWLETLPGSDGNYAHREWAIFAVPAADRFWLAKAQMLDGAWPLDRLIRTPLVWNSDGSAVAPADTAPPAKGVAGGVAGRVLLSTQGRSGVQTFNGSEGGIRGARPAAWDGTVTPTFAKAGEVLGMVGEAATAYMAADDSAYPSFRAMLPWTDPEAINPFYQGMENMNFNADLYRFVTAHAMRLAKMGHPEAERFIRHGEKSFDMALNRYVYPDSGCWEESHGYAGHTIGVVGPLAVALRDSRRRNFLDDVRFARMMEFFLYVHSPIDAEWGSRVVPAVGDHGQSRGGPAERFRSIVGVFASSRNGDIQRIVRNVAWMIREDGGIPPAGVAPEKPDLSSRYLRGYGSVLRAAGRAETALVLTLKGALPRGDKQPGADLFLVLRPTADGGWSGAVAGSAPAYNQGEHTGTLRASKADGATELQIDLTVGDDRWVKGGKALFVVTLRQDRGAWGGTFAGTFNGKASSGAVTSRTEGRSEESFLVVRAGQSWGHHHEDKGSLWFWGRNVHFFGDCSWGGPPGGTYGNKYKQGPAGGTQIEFVGVNNWPLPCKYPAPWIADDEYAADFDYTLARCMYPYNPPMDLSRSTPVALRNAYDRQVLFVHPRAAAAGPAARAADSPGQADLLIVRDNVESACPTIWRMHSFQPAGATVNGNRATFASQQGVVGELEIVFPAGPWKTDDLAATCKGTDYLKLRDHVPPADTQVMRVIDRDVLNDKYHDAQGRPLPFEELPKFGGSVELRWDMPSGPAAAARGGPSAATWVYSVHDKAEPAATNRLLDPQGRVVAVKCPDGSEAVALLSVEPFQFAAEGIDFDGTAGLVIRKDGKSRVYPIRATKLTAK